MRTCRIGLLLSFILAQALFHHAMSLSSHLPRAREWLYACAAISGSRIEGMRTQLSSYGPAVSSTNQFYSYSPTFSSTSRICSYTTTAGSSYSSWRIHRQLGRSRSCSLRLYSSNIKSATKPDENLDVGVPINSGLGQEKLLYVDNDIIVVDKPSNAQTAPGFLDKDSLATRISLLFSIDRVDKMIVHR
jgi:hypothetical protein